MKKILLCIFVFLLCLYFYTIPKIDVKEETKEEITPKEEKVVKLLDNGEVINILLEDYIVGVVACEMPASFEYEALKAQAVASRTYALEKINGMGEYDLENSTNNQCYHSKEIMSSKWGNDFEKYYNKIKESVYETKGEYLTYNGKIIKAFYFSTSNGYTENVESVFSQKLDYLIAVESPWDTELSSFEKETSFSKEEFLKLLGLEVKEKIEINIDSKTISGRVNYITINDNTYRGTTFRKLLSLRSTDFEIKEDGERILITTKGYGHGVGLSQNGANGMAKEGKDYEAILKHFYTNVEINNV